MINYTFQDNDHAKQLDFIKTLKESEFATKEMSEKVNALKEQAFHCFTLGPITANNYFEIISTFAEVCPSTALGFSMHLYTVWGLRLRENEHIQRYLEKVESENALFSSLNEPALYFTDPSQLSTKSYSLVGKKHGDGYIVNGMKKFVSFQPYVRYLPSYCLVEQENGNEIIVLILDKESPGVTVYHDWDSIAMSSTHSNSIGFTNVYVPSSAIISVEKMKISNFSIQGYLFRFNVASVYFGIAKKVVDYIIKLCHYKKVPNSNKTLSFFPGVQFTLAEMLILLETSISQIYHFAKVLDQFIENKKEVATKINSISLITKEYVTKSAEEIVNKAMKIEGIHSLSANSPLSSLYKDVKAGRFHPPQSDITYEIIAKEKLGIISRTTRWL